MTNDLTFRARLTYVAHLFKAITQQHHLSLRPLFEKCIPANGVVVDVGAHAGQFTKLFASIVRDGRVYAFEPGSYALSILRKVCFVHHLKNVLIVPLGLSDHETQAILQIPVKKSGSIGFGLSTLGAVQNGRRSQVEDVSLITLDRFAQENAFQRLDMIKADVEGWELRMLEGARLSIEKFSPVLVLEAEDKMLIRAGASQEKLMKFLSEMRYEVFSHSNTGQLTSATSDSTALFCVPRKKELR
jgi:FkbM family methyltransferase